MKEVSVLARFPEKRYQREGVPLEIFGTGRGSNLGIAINRAVRVILQSPELKHKSPLHIFLSVGIDGTQPITFWQLVHR